VGYPDSKQRTFQIRLPMRVLVSKYTFKSLNLNIYRNLHFYQLNYQKKTFCDLVKPLLRHVPKLGKIHLHYEVYPKSKREMDLMNVGSIVDKYFSDTLVNCGIIEDDNHNFINFASFGFGGISKKAHVLVTITEIETRSKEPMRILLDQNDIQTALETYVGTLGIANASGVTISLSDGEIVAEVQTGGGSKPSAVASILKPKGRGGRPKGSKNKPKEETEENVQAGDSDGSILGSGGADSGTEAEDPNETETSTSGESKPEGKKSKNLFGDSPEESSTGEDQTPEVEEEDPEPKKAKKSSIFDT